MENSNALWDLSTIYPPRNASHPSFSSSTASPLASDPVAPSNMAYMAAELVIAFLSTAGNSLVCAAVGLNRKLRTVTNYFLVSLAVADICVGVIAIPFAILTDMGLPRHNLYLCLLMLSVLIMFTQSSIFSLLAVAVDRYVAIFKPLRYQVLMTSRNAVLVILTTWLLAFLIGLVPLMGWHKTPPDSSYCFFVMVMDMTYMVSFMFFTWLIIPLVIMFLIYAQIFVAVKRQLKRTASEQSGREQRQMKVVANMRREMRMATSLFLVLFIFTICWIPLHIINCFLLLCPHCPVPLELLLASIILSHANSAVNPFLYAYTMTAFKDTFKEIVLCCRTGKDTQPSNMAVSDDTEEEDRT